MGLDIYLYTAGQARQNAEYDEASEALHEGGPDGKSPRDKMSDEEYAAWRQRYSYSTKQDVPSEKYPDHLFNRRYLRSSYNGGGFNHAVPQFIGTGETAEYPNQRGSLYWIFEPIGREWDGDDGYLGPDDIAKLEASKARALEIVEALKSSDKLRVFTASPNVFSGPPAITDDEALRMYREQVAQRPIGPDDWWSNRDMEVFGDGMTVLAAIPGKATFGVPGVHLIYRGSAIDSYIQSAEIVVEFCDEAISLIRRDGGCRMSWSG
jgi:hypothetical protein